MDWEQFTASAPELSVTLDSTIALYCVECGKYYETDAALRTHTKSKVHKRRLKDLKEGAYTVEESQRAAGMSAPDNRQRGVEDVVRRFGETGVASKEEAFAHSAPAPKA